MAFESKRLRVQLPCGEMTLFEQEAHGQAVHADILMTCIAGASCDVGRSGWHPTVGIRPCGATCGWSCNQTCGYTGDPFLARGVVVDPDQLPVLRAQLEVQLKQAKEQLNEVEAAERTVEERQSEA